MKTTQNIKKQTDQRNPSFLNSSITNSPFIKECEFWSFS